MTDLENVTIVSVVFDNTALLLENAACVDHFNGGDLPRWIVVDNSPELHAWPELPPRMEVVAGVPRVDGRDAGSLHHASGLEVGVKLIRTRYALLLDADFYVIRPHWIAVVLQHMRSRRLALFGSAWHPRWYYQYRYFPSVHFMLIDGEQLPFNALDLKPRIHADRWWRLISDDRLPVPFRKTFKATRIRDTGWSLYRRHFRDPAIARECLVAHFAPDDSLRRRLEVLLRPFLPESLCLYPKDQSAHTQQTFLRNDFPQAYAAGWEEFYWCGAPFAFHLRQVGRRIHGQSTEMDMAQLGRVLERYRREPPE